MLRAFHSVGEDDGGEGMRKQEEALGLRTR